MNYLELKLQNRIIILLSWGFEQYLIGEQICYVKKDCVVNKADILDLTHKEWQDIKKIGRHE